jgi:hypothetical protein
MSAHGYEGNSCRLMGLIWVQEVQILDNGIGLGKGAPTFYAKKLMTRGKAPNSFE